MKKLICLGVILVVLLGFGISWAGEKEELQWKARALVAEVNYFRSKAQDAQKAIEEFVKELDIKGYMFTQDGTIVEKPKPSESKPLEKK